MTSKPKAGFLLSHITLAFLLPTFGSMNCAARAQQGLSPQQESEERRAERLNQQFKSEFARGNYPEAVKLGKAYAELIESLLGPDHPDVARAKTDLAAAHNISGDSAQARPLAERAVEIYERAGITNDVVYAKMLANLAWVLSSSADYARAEKVFDQALKLLESLRGPEHPEVAQLLNTMSSHYLATRDYIKAERVLKRVLEIRVKTSGKQTIPYALALNNLAALYDEKGDPATALPLYRQALDIFDHWRITDHPNLSMILTNLGALYLMQREYDLAEPLLLRSIEMLKKKLGEGSPEIGEAVGNLAAVYYRRGDYDRAQSLYESVKAIYEKKPGADHPSLAIILSNLASVLMAKRDYDAAQPLYERALAIEQKAFGPEHPFVAMVLFNMAQLNLARGNAKQAVEVLAKSNEIKDQYIKYLLALGSERQKRAYMQQLSDETSFTVSLHLKHDEPNPEAARLALRTLLRRKGRVFDAVADTYRPLREGLAEQDRADFAELNKAYRAFASLAFRGPGRNDIDKYRKEILSLHEHIQRIESKISDSLAALGSELDPISLKTIQAEIPEGAALLEFVAYREFDPHFRREDDAFGQERYGLYILRREGEPAWVDVGTAAQINDAIKMLRDAVRQPGQRSVRQPAEALYNLLFRRIRPKLEGVKTLFVSPDGLLNLAPLAALTDGTGHYLIARYSLVFLSSGRDLLRFKSSPPSRQQPLILANPDFDDPGDGSPGPPRPEVAAAPQRSGDIPEQFFRPIPGAAQEADAIAGILRGASPLKAGQATEQVIKNANSPGILHLATHGFFLTDQTQPRRAHSLMSADRLARPDVAIEKENPLLRSGLAFAGANRLRSGGEDGILTALEASGLSLSGTKLVVLSACDTGLGQVENGEGVYGLRRAFALAGAQSLVMSMWKVDDEVTRDLMIAYYRLLKQGMGRNDALRRVQLNLLEGKLPDGAARKTVRARQSSRSERMRDLRHPYYWASFIHFGDWSSLPSSVFKD